MKISFYWLVDARLALKSPHLVYGMLTCFGATRLDLTITGRVVHVRRCNCCAANCNPLSRLAANTSACISVLIGP